MVPLDVIWIEVKCNLACRTDGPVVGHGPVLCLGIDVVRRWISETRHYLGTPSHCWRTFGDHTLAAAVNFRWPSITIMNASPGIAYVVNPSEVMYLVSSHTIAETTPLSKTSRRHCTWHRSDVCASVLINVAETAA